MVLTAVSGEPDAWFQVLMSALYVLIHTLGLYVMFALNI